MALIITSSRNFIEIALDGVTNFDCNVDLTSYGYLKNAEDGLRVRKLIFKPSQAGDQVIVRDGENGPAMFSAVNVLGDYDILKDEFREDGKNDIGKLMDLYIHANESVVGLANLAFLIIEL